MLAAPLLVVVALAGPGPTYEITELGSLFGSHTHVFDMNEIGDVVGLSRGGGLYSAPFVWSDGVMTPLPTFGGSVSESGATDILDDGTIVGYSATAVFHDPPFETCEIIRAFRYTGGPALQNLGSLSAGGDSIATGVNAAGRIVGWSHTNVQTLTYHAFRWDDGVMTDLGTLGGGASAAWDVDASGRIVGESTTSTGDIHAFRWQDGVMTDIDTFGSRQSVARAMNEAGQATGMWRLSLSDSPRSFIHDGLAMVDIGTLGGDYAEAFDVNDRGEVVGTTTTAEDDLTGFIWRAGVMTDLRDLAPGLPDGFTGLAIDDAGRIAGTAWVGSTQRAYLLTPVVTGDVDGDGIVSFADVLALLAAWGPCPAPCPADVDEDGSVGFSDLLLVLGNWS